VGRDSRGAARGVGLALPHQQVRDESHRLAITFHRELRDKAMTVSVLEEVPGVGPKRRRPSCPLWP
jgi:hypothetical protein